MAELLAANQITIAKVLDGEKGENGDKGDTGADGKTSYFHIKYSAVANPTSSLEMSETPLAYIGTYVDFTEADSTDPTKYTWSRFEGIQGEKGEQGIPGIGTDGKTSYLHIAYATSADGSEGFSVTESANKTYIGQYTDFVSTDSTDYTKYAWTKIKGEMSAEQLAQLNQASEDASQAQTDIDTLSDKTRSGYIETLSGSGFVQSTKTEDGGTAEVVVYGKSVQDGIPTPEVPVGIQSVENPKVTVTAKNLLGGEALANVIVEKGGTKNLSNKTVQWSCSAVGEESIIDSIKFKENTQYTFVFYGKCLNASAKNTNLKIYYTDGSNHAVWNFEKTDAFSFSITQSIKDKTVKEVRFDWSTTGTILEYEKCGIFEGAITAEQFEQYTGKTATLSDIVLRSTPDGTSDRVIKDSDGLWKIERNVGYKTLNGAATESWIRGTYYNNYWFAINIKAKWSSLQGYGYCDKFTETRTSSGSLVEAMSYSSDCQYVFGGYTTTENGFFVRYDNITTVAEWKEWLASNPVTVQYVMTAPTYETLPDSIQAELNALTTYNPTTNVMVSDGITPDIDVSFWTRDYYAKNAAENAAKVATNFLGYDSTNGLIIGNKASGAWSGYRSQILPDSFNILDESSTVLASFGTTTVIGEEAKANMHLTFNNLSMVDANGTEFFKVGDTRNADGIATLKSIATPYINSTGSVTLIFESSISSVISVYVNSVELSSSNYSVSGKRITFRNLTPNSRPTIETTFTTTEPSFYLTFGNRLSSGKTGKYSVAEGKDVIASGFASRAEGVNTEASGEYSHAGGYHTKASGDCSYAGGYWTVADGDYVTAIGRYNRKYTGINDKVFVIGNGSSDTNRSNALAVDWNGNLTLGTPLSVENGGTGATTAAAARANLEIYQRELVWDNANDTQKFAAQTIALDLSSYDYAEVHFFVSSTYDERVVGIGIIHERASHIYAQVMSDVDTSDTPIYVTQRVANVSANGVTFSDAYTKFITSTSTQQNNNRMVPTKIYAFKALEA